MRQISYDVMRTSKFWGMRWEEMREARSSFEPVRVTMEKSGAHLENSRAQFWRVDLGTTTRWGPQMPRTCLR